MARGIEGTEPAPATKVALGRSLASFTGHAPARHPANLARLRPPHPGAPSAGALRALHRAHVERIAPEALEIQLGRPPSIDPEESAARILARHRGGCCFHLNGASSLLLEALGYDVVWHRAGVQNRSDPARSAPRSRTTSR